MSENLDQVVARLADPSERMAEHVVEDVHPQADERPPAERPQHADAGDQHQEHELLHPTPPLTASTADAPTPAAAVRATASHVCVRTTHSRAIAPASSRTATSLGLRN